MQFHTGFIFTKSASTTQKPPGVGLVQLRYYFKILTSLNTAVN